MLSWWTFRTCWSRGNSVNYVYWSSDTTPESHWHGQNAFCFHWETFVILQFWNSITQTSSNAMAPQMRQWIMKWLNYCNSVRKGKESCTHFNHYLLRRKPKSPLYNWHDTQREITFYVVLLTLFSRAKMSKMAWYPIVGSFLNNLRLLWYINLINSRSCILPCPSDAVRFQCMGGYHAAQCILKRLNKNINYLLELKNFQQ